MRALLDWIRSKPRRADDDERLTLPPLFNWEAELRHAPSPPAGGYPDICWEDDVPWWRTKYGRWRLAAEITAMGRFPDFELSVSEDDLPRWRGWLQSAVGYAGRYRVEVTYPRGFPDEAPEVAILSPQLPEEVPHLLSNQRPCLYRGGSDAGYDPGCTTAATLVAWTALWVHAFETWCTTGRWPGAAV